MRRKVAFVVPPGRAGVVRDYAGGLGFEPRSNYVLPPLDLLQLAAVAARTWSVSLFDGSWSDAGSDAVDEVMQASPSAVIVLSILVSVAVIKS